jgi:intron-binding protein aquarius
LLNDILRQRCGDGTPLAGVRPGAVSTVDHYQGQQNDYVILSFVRTQAVGHVRDVRRLVVAVSRARLGLYVLCRQSLFLPCLELKPCLEQFVAKGRSTQLQIVTGEHYPTERSLDEKVPSKSTLEVTDVSHLGSIVHSMQEQLLTTGNK